MSEAMYFMLHLTVIVVCACLCVAFLVGLFEHLRDAWND
jgi:flagellar biosynthesis protein FliQ